MDVASLAHQVRGRIRFRIPGRGKDHAYFAELENRMADCPGISYVETCPRTTSLLVRYGDGTEPAAIVAYAENSGLFRLEGNPVSVKPTLNERAAKAVDFADKALLRISNGHFDVSSAILVTLLGVSARQAIRGQILLPATSLLWYAYTLVSAKRSEK